MCVVLLLILLLVPNLSGCRRSQKSPIAFVQARRLQLQALIHDPHSRLTLGEVDELYRQQEELLAEARERLVSHPLQDVSDQSLSPPERHRD